ncbi:MAG: hypothetical protein GC137_01810 [Alphaproteobacteria bacterium]|nr:hypothetical protein [Alphaproteobacteria bacterium]
MAKNYKNYGEDGGRGRGCRSVEQPFSGATGKPESATHIPEVHMEPDELRMIPQPLKESCMTERDEGPVGMGRAGTDFDVRLDPDF